MSKKTINIEILRYNPESDEKPGYGRFEVPFLEEWSVLDALEYIKDELDSSLAYRWSCRMAVCGSCGMVINGTPKLGCETFLRDYKSTIKVEPLANFPIERDLVVDAEDFIKKLESVKPYIINAMEKPVAEGVNKQTPKELGLYKQFSSCINCMLCYSACPQMGINPLFTGPAVIALGHRYNLDTRDDGYDERTEVIQGKNGVWSCTFVGYCSEVCPKNVDPAAAINQNKLQGAQDWALSFLMPLKGGK
ncbi:succinate dehydrogenase/fumarate reductase iron-sulfur subunit [Endozoicomonas sp. SESOKO4]|uniref:succinate dehydrogenase/fumarate reductase iron-sulfur subunit n=1 Tax=Endozoicomonas sp. SESOKO4 TaxID=2828745 RepID=UPI0021477507|nr:succinate dehydrogenase/fumarate reductase iron-sulfur subunit [Endozoicomonas sp. SESOKO4]